MTEKLQERRRKLERLEQRWRDLCAEIRDARQRFGRCQITRPAGREKRGIWSDIKALKVVINNLETKG
jgi:hypothetical protein